MKRQLNAVVLSACNAFVDVVPLSDGRYKALTRRRVYTGTIAGTPLPAFSFQILGCGVTEAGEATISFKFGYLDPAGNVMRLRYKEVVRANAMLVSANVECTYGCCRVSH